MQSVNGKYQAFHCCTNFSGNIIRLELTPMLIGIEFAVVQQWLPVIKWAVCSW